MKKKTTTKKKIKKKKKSKKEYLNGIDEEEFLKTVDKITKKLVYKFKFGYHDIEDMKQQATIFAIQGLEYYDKKRPLENFLWTHVRNRLFNYKRDNYQRPDQPCNTCPFFDKNYECSINQCSEYKNKNDCEIFNAWDKKNSAKKNIMKPLAIEHVSEMKSSLCSKDLIKNKELLKIIDEKIPIKIRSSYLNFLAGQKIPKKEYENLVSAIRQILNIQEDENE